MLLMGSDLKSPPGGAQEISLAYSSFHHSKLAEVISYLRTTDLRLETVRNDSCEWCGGISMAKGHERDAISSNLRLLRSWNKNLYSFTIRICALYC